MRYDEVAEVQVLLLTLKGSLVGLELGVVGLVGVRGLGREDGFRGGLSRSEGFADSELFFTVASIVGVFHTNTDGGIVGGTVLEVNLVRTGEFAFDAVERRRRFDDSHKLAPIPLPPEGEVVTS